MITSPKPLGMRPLLVISPKSPNQTVGTPQAEKTFSLSIKSKILFPSKCGPGKIIDAPTKGAT